MTRHAVQRAKERYGLDLTEKDLEWIAKFCWSGNAGEPMLIKDIHGHYKKPFKSLKIFRFVYRDKLVEVVVRRHKDGALRVLTFNPPPDGKPNYVESMSLQKYMEVRNE